MTTKYDPLLGMDVTANNDGTFSASGGGWFQDALTGIQGLGSAYFNAKAANANAKAQQANAQAQAVQGNNLKRVAVIGGGLALLAVIGWLVFRPRAGK